MDELDINAGLSLANELAFPRLCGTPGEPRAAHILQARFSELGWQGTAQQVLISNAIAINLKSLVLLLAMIGAASWLPTRHYLICAVFIGIFCFALANDVWSRSARGKTFGIRSRQVAESSNLFFVCAPNKMPPVWLVAHYDSKGQTLSLSLRVLLISTLCVCMVISLVSALVSLWSFDNALVLLQTISGSLALGCALPLLLMRTTNESPGALDNAGSVGVVYALAKAWQRQRASAPGFGILLTTGEEWGLVGAYTAAKFLAEKYSERPKPFFVNLEGVGGSMNLCWGLPPGRLQKQVLPYISELRTGKNIRLLRLLPGAAADHLAFWHHGIPAVTLLAFGKKLRHVHTPADTFDKIDVEAFTFTAEQLLIFLQRIFQKLAPQ